MDPQLTKYRRSPFGVTLLAYLLPFLTMTCMGQRQTFSGMQLAFGTSVAGRTMQGEGLAIVVLMLAAIGLLVSFGPAVSAALKAEIGCSGVAALVLLLLQSKIQREAEPQGVQVTFEFGYWLAFLALVAACIRGVLALRATRASEVGGGKASDRTPLS